MRVVLHNPHSESLFGSTVLNFFLRVHSFKRYQYLLEYALTHNVSLAIIADSSSFPPYISRYIPINLEVYLWLLINKYSLFKIKVLRNYSDLTEDDIFLSFSLGNLDKENKKLKSLKNTKAIKIFHLTHFISNVQLIAKNIELVNTDFIIAENNLHKNSKFFRHFFKNYRKDVYTLPFVFQPRFQKITPFNKRKNKCVATGSVIKVTEFYNGGKIFKDFISFFKTNTVHPLRAEIMEKKDQLGAVMDSYISNFWETKRRDWKSSDFFLKRTVSIFYNAFFASKRKYFSFNIVELYNSYKMFVVPEEINNLPGISFVEGMACGTAYIGIVDPMYTDIGLKPNYHYIGYNGTLKDLERKVQFYQKHPKELKNIAGKGYEFISQHLNANTVAEKFFTDLQKVNSQYKKNNYNKTSLSLKY